MKLQIHAYRYQPRVIEFSDNASDFEIIMKVKMQTKYKSWVGFKVK